MKYSEIFSNSLLILPKAVPNNDSFDSYLFALLDSYMNVLKSIDDETLVIEGLKRNVIVQNIIPIQQNFVDGIKSAINFYLEGHPAKAYTAFSDMMQSRTSKYKKLLNVGEFGKDESFYRIRIKEDNYPIPASEMFHIPFELRGRVSTQRYSIPGFPSLYLSRTLYVAWEELNRPSLTNFQAVMLRTTESFKYLDLTPIDWGENDNHKDAYKYLMTWPLIAACSIRVKNSADIFKPEYIFPQLLLQWIRENKELDGIKYNSTHVETGMLKDSDQLFNIVLPVKENRRSGHCSKLKELFLMTDPISWQMLELATGGTTYLHNEVSEIDEKIKRIEIIKGKKYPYSSSALGRMEEYLGFMTSQEIT